MEVKLIAQKQKDIQKFCLKTFYFCNSQGKRHGLHSLVCILIPYLENFYCFLQYTSALFLCNYFKCKIWSFFLFYFILSVNTVQYSSESNYLIQKCTGRLSKMNVCGFWWIVTDILSVKCVSPFFFFNDVLYLGLRNHHSDQVGHSSLHKWMIHSQMLLTVSHAYKTSSYFLQTFASEDIV